MGCAQQFAVATDEIWPVDSSPGGADLGILAGRTRQVRPHENNYPARSASSARRMASRWGRLELIQVSTRRWALRTVEWLLRPK